MSKKIIKAADLIDTEYNVESLKMMTDTISELYTKESGNKKGDKIVISYFRDIKKILDFIDKLEVEGKMPLN